MSHQNEFDEYGHKDHGHIIVPAVTLRLILAALLFFTLLTVGATEAEKWIAATFHVALPTWVNVFVALSIATVKTILVVMFFMQLKYDNPMNSLILVFTVMTVAAFLGFTALDLGKRETIDRFKSNYIVPGGHGGGPGLVFSGIPITQKAREDAIARNEYHPESHGHTAHAPGQDITNAGFVSKRASTGSSSQASRPVTGITIPDLPGYKAPDAHGHGHEPAGESHGAATPAAEHPSAPAPAAPAQPEPPKSGH